MATDTDGGPSAWMVAARNLPLFLQYVGRRYLRDRCLEAAASLAFTSLLALVPVAFVGLAVASAIPAFDEMRVSMQDFLLQRFVPDAGTAVTDDTSPFPGAGGRASTVGLIALAASTLVLMINIEAAFNAIWRVNERRPWIWRMVAFWAVLTMGPVLLGASLSFSGIWALALSGYEDSSLPLDGAALLITPLLIVLALTLIYSIIPNRPVRFVNALVGAVVAALLLETIRSVFTLIGLWGTPDHSVYAALVAFPVLLVELFAIWAAAMFGAVVAASIPEWRARREVLGRPHQSPGGRLSVGLAVLAELQAASRLGVVRRRRDLLRNLNLGAFIVESTLEELARAKYITRVGGDQWVLARDLEHVTLYDLYWDLNLGIGTDPFRWMRPTFWQSQASEMIDAFDASGRSCMDVKLKDLFAHRPASTPESPTTESPTTEPPTTESPTTDPPSAG